MSSSIHLANLSNVQAEQFSRFHCQKTPCGATTRADVISKMPGTTEAIVEDGMFNEHCVWRNRHNLLLPFEGH
jgi:hypothetical protein